MVRRRFSAVSNHESPDLARGHPSRRPRLRGLLRMRRFYAAATFTGRAIIKMIRAANTHSAPATKNAGR